MLHGWKHEQERIQTQGEEQPVPVPLSAVKVPCARHADLAKGSGEGASEWGDVRRGDRFGSMSPPRQVPAALEHVAERTRWETVVRRLTHSRRVA